MTEGTPHVELRSVSKSYKGRAVLKNLDLCIGPGDFVTFIGPSGCGKSTVLKLIAGLTMASSGTIRVSGMNPKEARKTISFIFQDAALLPWRTVRQNVDLGAELEGIDRAQRTAKTNGLLRLVGLEHAAAAYPRELSGGMKMRVSIARALATNPRLLLMDEPFAALDELSRDRLNEELLRLRAEQNWTAAFVTHSVAEAVFLSTRIIVLAANPGRVHAEIPVALPSSRTAATRETPEFEVLAAEVSHVLREAAAQ